MSHTSEEESHNTTTHHHQFLGNPVVVPGKVENAAAAAPAAKKRRSLPGNPGALLLPVLRNCRKDSFITHRAFCDALAEENYRANHGLAAMVGNLQSQQTQEMFSHSMPSLNSSTVDSMMNSSSSEPANANNLNPLKPLSLNPFAPPPSSDMMYNPNPSRAPNSSLHMSLGNSHMSATALLQKAAEMGARVSDDSISPILLRGFTGYSATPRQAGSVREHSSGPPEASEYRSSTFAPLLPMSGGGEIGGMEMELGSGMQRNNNREESSVVEGRDVRMTQDFLGLGGAVGSVNMMSEPSYGQDGVGLSYSGGHQDQINQHGMYSYQHMSHGPSSMEKQMWEF